MARQVKGRIPGRVVRSAFYGDDPKGEPVWVTYRVPTEREKEEIAVYGDALIVSADKSMRMDGASIIAQRAHGLANLVKLVENYNDAAGQPIVDGAALAEHGDSDIKRDIYTEIMASAELSEDAAKKSNGSPGSDSVATPPSVGTVTSAVEMALPAPETAPATGKPSSIEPASSR